MSSHEELMNLKSRIEDLERRNAEALGIATECARQLQAVTAQLQVVSTFGHSLANELAVTQKSLMTLLERAIESN